MFKLYAQLTNLPPVSLGQPGFNTALNHFLLLMVGFSNHGTLSFFRLFTNANFLRSGLVSSALSFHVEGVEKCIKKYSNLAGGLWSSILYRVTQRKRTDLYI